mgnify:CR=1 FL=1
MTILAIDSSGLVASVAIMTEEAMLAEYTVNYKKTHSQTLLPMIDEIVTMLEIDMNMIDAIAIAKGPGSFTGLRIGSATAKGLGLALDKPIIEIPTLDALAYNVFSQDCIICPLMDARRNQVYTGLYTFKENEFTILEEQCAVELPEKVNKLEQRVVFLGDGVDAYKKQIEELVKVPYMFAPSHIAKQRAGAVGALAFMHYKDDAMKTAMEHVPTYLRLSQAERELAEKQKQEKTSDN